MSSIRRHMSEHADTHLLSQFDGLDGQNSASCGSTGIGQVAVGFPKPPSR